MCGSYVQPLGVLIIEGCEVQMEDVSERQFVFSIGKKSFVLFSTSH